MKKPKQRNNLLLFCICGAAWTGFIPEAAGRAAIMQEWNRHHKPTNILDEYGDVHAPCDCRAAARARARRKAEAYEDKRRD